MYVYCVCVSVCVEGVNVGECVCICNYVALCVGSVWMCGGCECVDGVIVGVGVYVSVCHYAGYV